MARITFQYRSSKSSGNLTIRLTHGTSKHGIDIKTTSSIQSKRVHWYSKSNKSKNLLKSTSLNVDAKNHKRRLEDFKFEIENKFLSDFNNGIPITSKWLKEVSSKLWDSEIKDTKNKIRDAEFTNNQIDESNLLTNAIKGIFIKYQSNNNELKKYKVTLSIIEKYQEVTGRIYKTKEVNNKFVDEFKNWCLMEMNYKRSYINSLLKRIKASIKYAYTNDEEDIIEISKQLESISYFKDVYKEKVVVSLNYDEIDKIDRTDFSDPELLNAKRVLLIGCETGLRYSDMNKLIESNIKSVDGVNYFSFLTSKTKARVQITISERLLYLINKYGLPTNESPNEDIKLNRLFKQICRKAKIDEPTYADKIIMVEVKDKKAKRTVRDTFPKYKLVTTRTLRRSFATNYFGKIDTQLIMNVTGHKTEKMLRAYLNASDDSNVVKSKQQIDKYHSERKIARENQRLTKIPRLG